MSNHMRLVLPILPFFQCRTQRRDGVMSELAFARSDAMACALLTLAFLLLVERSAEAHLPYRQGN